MPKRKLRIVKETAPMIGVCEGCDAQFKSERESRVLANPTLEVGNLLCQEHGGYSALARLARIEIKALFAAHTCKPMDNS